MTTGPCPVRQRSLAQGDNGALLRATTELCPGRQRGLAQKRSVILSVAKNLSNESEQYSIFLNLFGIFWRQAVKILRFAQDDKRGFAQDDNGRCPERQWGPAQGDNWALLRSLLSFSRSVILSVAKNLSNESERYSILLNLFGIFWRQAV